MQRKPYLKSLGSVRDIALQLILLGFKPALLINLTLLSLLKVSQTLLGLVQGRLAVLSALHKCIPLADSNINLGLLGIYLRRPGLKVLLLLLDLVVEHTSFVWHELSFAFTEDAEAKYLRGCLGFPSTFSLRSPG